MSGRKLTIYSWISRQKLPLIITVFFTVLWFVQKIPADISADIDQYVWVSRLRALALIAYGTLYLITLILDFILSLLLSALFQTPLADIPDLAIPFFALAVFGFSSIVLATLKRDRRYGIVILIGFFGCNLLCSLVTLIPVETAEISSRESCEHFVTESRGIRLTCFEVKEGGNNSWPDVAFRLYSTQDGGQSWERQTHMLDVYFWDQNYLNSILEDFNYCDCSNLKQLSDEFFWFWKQRIFAVTHDGGTTWYVTQEWDVPYRRSGLQIGDKGIEVNDVVFENRQRGCALFTDVEYGYTALGFVTDDGGQTWDFDGTYLNSEGCKGRCECITHWQLDNEP